jgi:hypothetical protein
VARPPLHARITDIPIGALLVAVLLDLLNQRAAADVALVVAVLFMLVAALSGAVDYIDTDGTARARATVHSTLMVVRAARAPGLARSCARRPGRPDDPRCPARSSGFLIVTARRYVGGDVVYQLGNMVSRHAWRGRGVKWIPLDFGDIDPAALPRRSRQGARRASTSLPSSGSAGLVRMHAVCAHAGRSAGRGRRSSTVASSARGTAAVSRWRNGYVRAGRPCTTSRPTRSAPSDGWRLRGAAPPA